MKKALILAYDFPPYVSVGGLRPYSWYRYFKEFDIYPVIITRQWENKYGNHLDYVSASESSKAEIEVSEFGTIVKAPYKANLSNRLLIKYGEHRFVLIRKAITAWFEIIQFLFMVGPKSPLYFAAKEYIGKNQVDIIIATGDPFILFRYAYKFSKKYNIAWLADFRDFWVHDITSNKNGLAKIWYRYLEKKYLRRSSYITTVSALINTEIERLNIGKKTYLIPNGFDPEAVKETHKIKQGNNILKIAFAGTIYRWHPWESVLSVFNEIVLKKEIIEIQINLYGVNIEDQIRQILHSKFQSLIPCVNFFSKIPNDKLLQELATHNLFLLFNDYSIIGTKIYNYVALKRRIILCYTGDKEAQSLKATYYDKKKILLMNSHEQEELIKETKCGILVKDAEDLKTQILNLYNEFISHGQLNCDSVNTERFSRRIQTEKLAEIINNYFNYEKRN